MLAESCGPSDDDWCGLRFSEKKITCVGVTEPHAGSDVKNIRTKAQKVGNKYLINGSKIFITNGVHGDI